MDLIKCPFKTDTIEDDPNGFALRPNEIELCSSNLYNNRNILITGPRGIGKSSLGAQMQRLYIPDNTLLERCNINGTFPKYLRIYYTCDKESSLSSICLDILYRIDEACILLKNSSKSKKATFEFNIGVFKLALENEIVSNIPGSIITQFIGGLNLAYKVIIQYGYKGINIRIDELDAIIENIDFAHFLKLFHEYSKNDGLLNLTLILTGQRGIYSKLTTLDPSVERLITHIPISKLGSAESEHILMYAQSIAAIPFKYEDNVIESILKIAGGYPYTIHLLGSAAYHAMEDKEVMKLEDVYEGLRNILSLDKHDKYIAYLAELSFEERIILVHSAKLPFSELPARINISEIMESISGSITNEVFSGKLKKLHERGLILYDKDEVTLQFNDELFRIFISLKEEQIEINTNSSETSVFSIDSNYDPEKLDEIVGLTESVNMSSDWEIDPYDDLVKF